MPVIASGTTELTSCAKNPSKVVSGSSFQLNLDGFNVFNLVMPSVMVVTFSLSL